MNARRIENAIFDLTKCTRLKNMYLSAQEVKPIAGKATTILKILVMCIKRWITFKNL